MVAPFASTKPLSVALVAAAEVVVTVAAEAVVATTLPVVEVEEATVVDMVSVRLLLFETLLTN